MDPNQQDGIGRTLLHLACQDDDVAKVRALLDKGASIEVVDSAGMTPLTMAIKYGNVNVVKELLSREPKLDFQDEVHGASYLHRALNSEGKDEIVHALVEAGAPLNLRDKNGWAPVWFCMTNRRPDLIAYLAAHGADINAKNPMGMTPLHAARLQKDRKVVAALEKLGANDEGPAPEQMKSKRR